MNKYEWKLLARTTKQNKTYYQLTASIKDYCKRQSVPSLKCPTQFIQRFPYKVIKRWFKDYFTIYIKTKENNTLDNIYNQ